MRPENDEEGIRSFHFNESTDAWNFFRAVDLLDGVLVGYPRLGSPWTVRVIIKAAEREAEVIRLSAIGQLS